MIKNITYYFCALLILQIIVSAQAASDTQFVEKYKIEQSFKRINPPSRLSDIGASIEKIDPLKTEINYGMLAGMGAVTLGVGVAVHIYQANAWWKDQRQKFRFVNDWNYALWIDKVGHFFGANLLAHGFSGGLEAANVQSEESAIYSSILSLTFQMYVEIEDGFGAQWGFSPGDAASDFLGAAYYLGQYYYPVLKHFQPRVSYWPSEKFRSDQHQDGNIIDDYEGQKYWISIRMKEILPNNIAEYWPSFLMLAVGMGVKNLDGAGGGQREFYIAFDFDAETIPLHGKFWTFVKNTLNYQHFPMPGIRITPNAAFFGIVF